MSLSERLRGTVLDIRRKPYPISDLIPMLAEAADKLEELERLIKDLRDSPSCWQTRDKINTFISNQTNL